MIKRLFCFLLTFMLFISVLPVGHAAELVDEEIILLEDGRYLVITIEKIPSRSIYSQNGKKTITGKESDGTIAWKAELTGTYIYTGTSATCTQSNISVTMGRKVLGVTVAKETYNMTLTCSPTGTLS